MKCVIKYCLTFIAGSILSFLIILSSIGPGKSDWEYKLPNNYEVWRINSNEVIIKDVINESADTSIPSFIKEFSYNDRYVFTRNTSDIESNNILNDIYYILDTKEKTVYGPLKTMDEFKKKADEIQIAIPKKWHRTSPDPNMCK